MILGVIPARGGSKGIPRKNLRPIGGKPLIAWTLESAKKSRLMDRYVVSTEDDEIAAAARSRGVEVISRPSELATDQADTLEVLQHALKVAPAEIVVLLQPTSPIRAPGLIDRCIQRFLDANADSLATGFQCKYEEYGKGDKRRQDVAGFFYDDGNVYVIKADLIRRGDRYGRRIERVHLDREENVEIDDEFDLWIADQILRKRAQG